MTPYRGQVVRHLPGAGLYGPVPRDGQLATVLRPAGGGALGEWVVRWASDGATSVVCVLDLRDAGTPCFDFTRRED